MSEYRQISVEGRTILGKGGCGTVYRLDDDQVVKVYEKRISLPKIKREQKQTKGYVDMGLPCENCYDIVRVGDAYGVILELVDAKDMDEEIGAHRDMLDHYAVEMGKLLRKIHNCRPDVSVYPSTVEFYHNCVEKCKDEWLKDDEPLKLHRLIDAIPASGGLVHGDFHPKNIMAKDGKLKMIDVANSTSGHPVFDLLLSYYYMVLFPRDNPAGFAKKGAITAEESFRIWELMMRAYLSTDDTAKVKRVNDILESYAMLKLILTPASFINMKKELWSSFVEMGRKRLMPVIDEVTGIVPKDFTEV
ncbi:MAG: phosphotransferase [Lachnospiraceae bacterium]|nr:phosphotransferase [Lachnospiraceae bacterium]